MKRNITYLWMACACGLLSVLVGCSKDDEGDEKERKEYVELLWRVDDDIPQWKNAYCLFGNFHLEDASGFERHPYIDELTTETEVEVEEGILLQYSPKKIDAKIIPGNEEKAKGILNEIYKTRGSARGFITFPLSFLGKDPECVLMAGIKNDKIWIGQFDPETKEQTNEWVASGKTKRDFMYKDKKFHVDAVGISDLYGTVAKTPNGYAIVLDYLDDKSVGYCSGELCILYKNKMIQKKIEASQNIYDVYSWYEGSILFVDNKNNAKIFASDGKEIDAFTYSSRTYGPSPIPCSYTDYIEISASSIRRRSMLQYDDVWTNYETIPGLPSGATILSSEVEERPGDNYYIIKSIILASGDVKKTIRFGLNIETGYMYEY